MLAWYNFFMRKDKKHMTKQTWIKVKSGILEPKHREAMGVRVWLYLHILDLADWTTGTIEGWTDASIADEIGMTKSTIRRWRQELQDAGYITCQPTRGKQSIIIHNYTNPRQYSGAVKNPFEDGGIDKPDRAPAKSKPRSKKAPTIPKKDLERLRKHFSNVAKIKEPVWGSLDAKSRRKYGAWWNTPLKAMYINAGSDVERTIKAITKTLDDIDFAVYAPISIEKAYQKTLSTPEKVRLPNASQL